MDNQDPIAIAKPVKHRMLKRWALAISTFYILLIVAEIFCRILPFSYDAPAMFFYPSGNGTYIGTRFVYTPFIFIQPYYWLPEPDTELSNSRCFTGKREYPDVKEEGTIRVAMMGCSSTQGSVEPYPLRTERLLAEALGTNKYEVINGGVGSFSTHQGLQMFKDCVLPLKPDVVTVFYGWNDRWVHDRMRDSKHVFPSEKRLSFTSTLSQEYRLVKALVYLKTKWIQSHVEQRVPPDEYEKNLREFVQLCRENDIRVILCTTPDGSSRDLIESRFDVTHEPPDQWAMDLYHLYEDQADTPFDVWEHIQNVYNDTVIKVAEDEQVELLDLDRDVNARQSLFTTNNLPFYNDGIHFTPLGEQEMAILFAHKLTSPDEQAILSNYIFSPTYYFNNAFTFANGFAFNAADYYLQQIESGDHIIPSEDMRLLRSAIDNELPFYTAYSDARIAKGNAHDKMDTLAKFVYCINLRPYDQELRLNTAQDIADLGFYTDTLYILANAPEPYTPENQYRAQWLAFNTCRTAGFVQEAYQYLMDIRRDYPDDPQAEFYYQQLVEQRP